MGNLVAFNIENGVHALGVALGSEVFKLNEAERAQVTRCVVKASAGRVPIDHQLGRRRHRPRGVLHREAEALGADALMVIPPSSFPVSAEEILDYYQAIDPPSASPSCCRTCRRLRSRRASRSRSPRPAAT